MKADAMKILAADIGTTGTKMGVFVEKGDDLELLEQFSRNYAINTYNDGLFADIDPMAWIQAFRSGCEALGDLIADVDVVALSGTTPGLTAMDADGNALYPSILMLDQRSRQQAQHIIATAGIQPLMEATGNMPVAGGCSLASILWIKDNHPEAFEKTACFGHSNSYMAAWLTGEFAIDPSSASLMALYNTVENDLTWNGDIANQFGLSTDRLPRLIPSHESAGRMKSALARELGFRREPDVVIGGNDAVLAAYSVGVREPGDIMNVNGTCVITLVCLPRCLHSRNYNVRTHVIPGRWLTLYVMNAGGIAFEWFRTVYCSEMSPDEFYGNFAPRALDAWVGKEFTARYVPFLMGSRYSQAVLNASFEGLTRDTTREELLAALVKGLCDYQREHLKEVSIDVPLSDTICITGGAASPEVIRAKQRWMRDCNYDYHDQSSMKGAAMLGRVFLNQ
ncbi:MAG: hypothetical protein MI741_22710 [Rhodospirillales bacterium]|nr:hypothetical protein [Rhodospirillales bacterium]